MSIARSLQQTERWLASWVHTTAILVGLTGVAATVAMTAWQSTWAPPEPGPGPAPTTVLTPGPTPTSGPHGPAPTGPTTTDLPPAPATSTARPTTTMTRSAPATAEPVRPPTTRAGADPAAGPLALRWEGRVSLAAGGVDLDQAPPVTAATGHPASDLVKDHFTEVGAGPGAALRSWQGASVPGPDECGPHTGRGSGESPSEPAPGGFLCLRTDQGRVATVRYLGLADDARFAFDVRVWG